MPGKKICICILLPVFFFSCHNDETKLADSERTSVKASIAAMSAQLVEDLAAKGPVAWLNYFENTPDFFMASQGQRVFHNYAAADTFIRKSLVKNIHAIELEWTGMNIDPLTTTLADVSSAFHEVITDSTGNRKLSDGYFTALAEKTGSGWQFRNAHWSLMEKQ